jgi:ubiquinone/menaquinone biosynthesis C-methylase UbiE
MEKYYARGEEKERLNTHRLEKERTLAILKRWLPSAPAVILDVGGAAGVYAFPLTEQGYEVHLIDPVRLHIEQAQQEATRIDCPLASYTVGDARELTQADNCADVVLLFGPLYHLVSSEERLKALSEAFRVLKSGGMLFVAGISRFASFMDAVHKMAIEEKYAIIQEGFTSGVHRKLSDDSFFAYMHHPSELKEEVERAGFKNVSVRAIEGPVWEKNTLLPLENNDEIWKKFLSLIESIETEESIIGSSAHIMAIGKK